jgi:hypothetical protein
MAGKENRETAPEAREGRRLGWNCMVFTGVWNHNDIAF